MLSNPSRCRRSLHSRLSRRRKGYLAPRNINTAILSVAAAFASCTCCRPSPAVGLEVSHITRTIMLGPGSARRSLICPTPTPESASVLACGRTNRSRQILRLSCPRAGHDLILDITKPDLADKASAIIPTALADHLTTALLFISSNSHSHQNESLEPALFFV